MLRLIHWLMIFIYVAAPVAATVYAIIRAVEGRLAPAARLMITLSVGICVGTALTFAYATALRGHASPMQWALAIYITFSVLIVLKALDWIIRRALKLDQPVPLPQPGNEDGPYELPDESAMPALRGLLRGVLLIGIGLPYILSTLLIYRPRVICPEAPDLALRLSFSEVQFESTDGLRLAGWWIPAAEPRRRRAPRPADFGARTVLVCHGLGAGKADRIAMVRKLVPAGYNAFVFDFRAHGDSAGQFTSFGALERQDVLGAVRWLRQNHPAESKRIVGLGESTGAAALIAAAVDASPEGQAIEAIAVYGAFDDLGMLADDLADGLLLPPMDWLTPRIALPLASAQVGANLSRFKPAALVQRLWPRPILVIHGTNDHLIPFERGENLFKAASFPKLQLWLQGAGHNESLNDDMAADVVRYFFDTARPMRII